VSPLRVQTLSTFPLLCSRSYHKMFTPLNAMQEFDRLHREMNSIFHRSPLFANSAATSSLMNPSRHPFFGDPWEDTFALLDSRWPFNHQPQQVNQQQLEDKSKQNIIKPPETNTNKEQVTATHDTNVAPNGNNQLATTDARTGDVTPYRSPFDSWLSAFPNMNQLATVNVGLTETEKDYVVEAAVPQDLKKEDVHINLDTEHRLLTISGEKKQENEEKDEKDSNKVVRKSSSYTSFSRTVHLPRNCDLHEVKAKFDDANKLQIIVPKVEVKKTERIKKVNIE